MSNLHKHIDESYIKYKIIHSINYTDYLERRMSTMLRRERLDSQIKIDGNLKDTSREKSNERLDGRFLITSLKMARK